MKYLILTLVIATTVIFFSAKSFGEQLKDYQESSFCVKMKVAQGVERSQIEVIGSKCFVK